ncbi:MAG: enoyl-CoA hydratase [Pseudomonadota bacterium]
MTADDDLILTETTAPGVLQLTLNRPAAFNSLSSDLMTAFAAALDAAASDEGVRAIVVTGAGGRFCAGHDLKEVRGLNDAAARRALMEQCCALMTSIVRHPKPVIAKVRGIATAAGCQLVASCDLAVAEDGAKFSTPGVNIGLFCSTPMVALGRNVSRKHAMEMLLTGEMMTADEAVRFGLVNRAVEAASLDDATLEMAGKIASKSAYTVKIGKEAFYRQTEMDLDAAYAYAAEVMVENLAAADAEEGIGAFVEKRPPVWRDR